VTAARSLVAAPGRRISLDAIDPGETFGAAHDKRTKKKIERDLKELEDLQELLYAARQSSVLVVLQGLDASGKDGTIRHVFTALNPQGCRVTSFKVPTPEERAHDFLWRVHRDAPGLGEIAIFNRSHYEAMLVERVHGLAPEPVWRGRYREINDFERLLARSGTIIAKFFLHISKKEQRKRLEERIEDPDKRWKSNPDDWKERKLWGKYREAFEDMLRETSTSAAPWVIVPADHKWFRNLVVADEIVRRLRRHARFWKQELLERGRAAGG
jgi:PPK2 family polyphosphate:nucleotide phosphotransferase